MISIIIFVVIKLTCISISFAQPEDVILIFKSRSPSLATYEAFADAIIINFHVPENTIFASFKFVASETDQGIFGCETNKVSVYLKYESPPAINPDGSPFPKEFKNVSRSETYNIEFETNNKDAYINITSPNPGAYYAAIFLAYQDPRYRKISPQGFSSCKAFADTSLYVRKIDAPTIVSEFQLIDVISQSNQSRYFMVLVPDGMDHAILNVENIRFSNNVKQVVLRVQGRKPPSSDSYLIQSSLNDSSPSVQVLFTIEPLTWHYIEFEFQMDSISSTEISELNFELRFFLNRLPATRYLAHGAGNTTLYNMSVITKSYQTYRLTDVQPYTQYNLVRESSSRSFSFSYKLPPEMDYNMLVPINVTSNEFSVLRFNLQAGSDFGGTLQYTIAFKPRLTRQSKRTLSLTDEPAEHVIIGCIQKNSISIPTWPRYCISNDVSMLAPIVLNATTKNSTVLIPYPEGGTWYTSFKLFCGTCQPCLCPESCQQDYETCVIDCEFNCTADCQNCVESCKNTIVNKTECLTCNCDGGCQKDSGYACNSSVVFDISSAPCYYGDCGKQGKCGLLISDGIAYSSCICSNNYRGFDCSDGSQATPFYLVLLEFLLLVISNIFFMPAAYIAFRRGYYVETLSYTSVFISSSFYHACDAGENIISFCIFRLNALQFADFFSAMLAIWLTLLAMADLPHIHLSLLQMGGAMIIAFCVTLNRYAIWIFALPSILGLAIVILSWYLKYRKYRSRFIERKYLRYKLPIGSTFIILGLVIFGVLQTQENYKYLHSLWHIIMATGVIFVLPMKDTFQASALL